MIRCAARAVRIAFLSLLTACATAAPSGETSTGASAVTWRVATYNIHHARGMDSDVDLERVAAVIRSIDPDVVFLQEVDENVDRSGGVDQAARLGDLLGMHHAFGSFMGYQGGRYGMAILSRCVIRSADPVRLTEGNEPRIALAAELRSRSGETMTVVNVHFDWVGDDAFRYAQASEVAKYLDHSDGPWILAGDFNDEPGSRTLDLFQARAREAEKPTDAAFTFPSKAPVKEIDFIFVSPADEWGIAGVRVVSDTMASDHLPVVADLNRRSTNPQAASSPAC